MPTRELELPAALFVCLYVFSQFCGRSTGTRTTGKFRLSWSLSKTPACVAVGTR
jgi:hypothetical protein